MAASANGSKPNGDKKQVRKTRYTCPSCGNVSLFSTGEVMQCPACGHYASEDEPLVPVADLASPAVAPLAAQPPVAATPPRRDPPTGLAVGALACGLAAGVAMWAFPLSLLLAIAAIALGSTALSRHEDDAGVQVMSIIGIVVGGLVVLFAFVLWPFFFYDGGDYSYYDGGSSTNVEVENNQGGSGGGSGSGDGGGSGGSGGGGGTDVGVDSPAPAAVLVAMLLLGLAAWRRKA